MFIFIIFLFIQPCIGLWISRNHSIYYENKLYNIRGINWFGIESHCKIMHGLWIHPLSFYLDIFVDNGINSIRIPFSYEVANNLDMMIETSCVTSEPLFDGVSVRTMLNILFQETSKRSMTILLDFHTINEQITEFPWTNEINENMVFGAWSNIINEYKHYKNLIGIDIKNEPHGLIDWTTWGGYIKNFTYFIYTTQPDYQSLFFICGIEDPLDDSTWGGSFYSMKNNLTNTIDDRIVFSPHVYGPSVRGSRGMNNTDHNWDSWFGNLQHDYDNSIIIGEMGGYFDGNDELWHWNIFNYLLKKNIRNFYYWCMNPDSYDTNGIFERDWTTLNEKKINFIKYLQPFPTFLNLSK